MATQGSHSNGNITKKEQPQPMMLLANLCWRPDPPARFLGILVEILGKNQFVEPASFMPSDIPTYLLASLVTHLFRGNSGSFSFASFCQREQIKGKKRTFACHAL
jgi:hypothetical protein